MSEGIDLDAASNIAPQSQDAAASEDIRICEIRTKQRFFLLAAMGQQRGGDIASPGLGIDAQSLMPILCPAECPGKIARKLPWLGYKCGLPAQTNKSTV